MKYARLPRQRRKQKDRINALVGIASETAAEERSIAEWWTKYGREAKCSHQWFDNWIHRRVECWDCGALVDECHIAGHAEHTIRFHDGEPYRKKPGGCALFMTSAQYYRIIAAKGMVAK